MKLRVLTFLFFLLLGIISGTRAEKPTLQKGSTHWTGFRGNQGSSHTFVTNLPLTWSETENVAWTTRIGSSTWASPIAAGDMLYFFGKDGDTTVMQIPLQQTEIPPIVSVNSLTTESRVYGVAAINGAFLIRTGNRLICVGKP